MYDYDRYRAQSSEQQRTGDLLRLLPKSRRSVVDVGARDGHFSRLFTEHFSEVTALDLTRPAFVHPGVTTVAGDATALAFPDNSFDVVFCAEVLEHIPAVEKACQELVRVARHELLIGVPYRQDTRLGRTACPSCGAVNPPWGHVNEFDDARLARLFAGTTVIEKSFVGESQESTTALATWLMDLGGNPWGTYDQEEPCLQCGAKLVAPTGRGFGKKICSALAARMNRFQRSLTAPRGNWIHLLLRKAS